LWLADIEVNAVHLHRLVQDAAEAIAARVPFHPEVAIVLGSGLGGLADAVEAVGVVPFSQIPHFPTATVEGHAGRLVLGLLEGRPVAIMQGRIHYYEGYPMHEVVFPIRVLSALGCRTLLVTNAAGGLNPEWAAGDLMIITDHMNFQPNPLIGPNDDRLGPRFPNLRRPYDAALIRLAERCADEEGIAIRKGIYAATTGPSFAPLAEVRMLRLLGADATGMSTAPEVIAARHLEMRVLGITAITNMATGNEAASVGHGGVLESGRSVEPRLARLVRRILREIDRSD
jgi:purine-nucleoside phosphorylase